MGQIHWVPKLSGPDFIGATHAPNRAGAESRKRLLKRIWPKFSKFERWSLGDESREAKFFSGGGGGVEKAVASPGNV